MLKEIVSERKEQRQWPVNLNPDEKKIFEHELQRQLAAVHLLQLSKAFLLKDVVFRFPKFYDALSLKTRLPFFSRLKRIALLFLKGQRIKKGIWITDSWSLGYFHWLSDALPRLWAAKNHFDGHVVLLPSAYRRLGFVRESLDLLEIPFTYFNAKRKLGVDDLLIPGHVTETGHFNSEVMGQLRNFFLTKAGNANQFRKLFLSRRKAETRRLLNENEFEQLTAEYGFQTVFLEDMTFLQQIRLLNEASVIIGVHGAGLTNMLFMNPGTRMVELRRKEDSHNNCFFALASALDIQYYYLSCDATGSNTQTADFTANLQQARKLLSTL